MMLNSLFSLYNLKGRIVKNRCAVSPMVTNYCAGDGSATEKFIAYHEARAKGGWGLILTEDYAVDRRGRGFSHVAGLWDDGQIESHKELTRRVHRHGSVILAQIYHCGRQTSEAVIGAKPVAPSPIPCPMSPDIPARLAVDEIKTIVSHFGDAAYRARRCGFDGVEVHGAHGYLIAEFMSSYSNKRFDEYGGNIPGRMRFALEIIKDVRAKCGDDFIIGFRISADEFVEGGRTIEETVLIARMLEEAGVDILHVSAGVYASADAIVPPMYVRHGWIAGLAAEVKKQVGIPVITVGRVNDPFLAEGILKTGGADFVAMGRASLCDPELPVKAREGRFEDIRKCIGCNHGCIGILFTDNPIKCVLNPELGNEYVGETVRTRAPKRFAVVGAGPAGLETAIFLARAGHSVDVFEKEPQAGGQFYLAAVPPCKGEISDFIRWQLAQLRKLGVSVRYNLEVTAPFLAGGRYDGIIVATGATPAKLPVPGSNLPHVVTAHDVLAGVENVGHNVVVIGGGSVGAETANHLGVQLKNVTVVEMLPAIAPDEALAPRWHLLRSLEQRKVGLMTSTTVREIKSTSVVVQTAEGALELPADTVVIAAGSKPNNSLADELIKRGLPARVIGDAKSVGLVLDATEQAYRSALSV